MSKIEVKKEAKYDFGLIGLGAMGMNLLLNMGDHGISATGYDTDPAKCELLDQEGKRTHLKGFHDITAFVAGLKKPRAIIMLVPAGKIVDDVIAELAFLLERGDILIDAGNSYFKDTERRSKELSAKGFHFIGMGISGGEEGARRGPSLMPGGDREAFDVIKPVLTAIAAKVDRTPCVAYIGPGASGHFVKMVHNGIEYGLMQLIAETYEILKKGLHMNNEVIGALFNKWNTGRLGSFLLEITAYIFTYKESGQQHFLLDEIKDEARGKGTGKWTSQVAMDLEVPVPTIDIAVSMRDLSRYKNLREQAAELYNEPARLGLVPVGFLNALEEAFYISMMMTYAQGMHLLAKASEIYGYKLDLGEIARIWRGGCIIRSAFLSDVAKAYQAEPALPHLLLDKHIQRLVANAETGARKVLSATVTAGIATPAYAASISYFDAFRSQRMPANLIQAQRDLFGAHTYERTGQTGVFHTQWVIEEERDHRLI
ncbi:NADP-dependent phosphogluconate dehydrogenase [Mucilaginibacter sp.]|jgi:6-phosphogluconate dehydrogenase|uniref:NADP-dependent phosphogluconate dehydrogenase n=1 Tax=Mucilaginibacter sp. TaxID=1882438 RepID=UPI003569B82C